MDENIRNLAIATLFIFPGLAALPQEVPQEEAPIVEAAQEFGGNVNWPHPIIIP